MAGHITTKKFRISGMVCSGCESRIEKRLLGLDGVKSVSVSYRSGFASVIYDSAIVTRDAITEAIDLQGYKVEEMEASGFAGKNLLKAVGAAVVILAVYLMLDWYGAFGFFNSFPLAKQGMGFGMLFIIGLLTSVHCIAMCGGINLSQSINKDQATGSGTPATLTVQALKAPFMYNAGRVISYTAIGGLVGALGSVVSFTGYARGIVQLVAGVFMVLMGLNMMGMLPSISRIVPGLPKVLGDKVGRYQTGRGPLIIGLLNGLMPCGPLQAMQLYALSTGSLAGGALSMFFFSIGTVPLMFGLGALSSMLSRRLKGGLVIAGAVLVVFLGVVMFGNGIGLTGASVPALAVEKPAGNVAVIVDGVQIVSSRVLSNSYEPITVQKGVPVRWTLKAEKAAINGCNNRIIIPSLKKEKKIEPGNNVVEFTPTETGTIPFSCWMGMIRSKIVVVDDIGSPSKGATDVTVTDQPSQVQQAPLTAPSCCP